MYACVCVCVCACVCVCVCACACVCASCRWNSCKQNKQGNSCPSGQGAVQQATPSPEGEKMHSDSGISVDSQSLQEGHSTSQTGTAAHSAQVHAHTHTHTCHRHTHTHTRDFFKTANSPKFQKIKWSNVYCCVNISLTRNALEHVHLEDEFVQNQLLIAGRLTRFPSHTFP